MEKIRKKRYLILFILVAFFILSATILLFKKPAAKIVVEERSWAVKTFKAKRGTYQPELILYGEVDSPQKSTLASTLKATVTAVPVREGEQVQKGALLISLDEEEYALIVKQREAQIKRLQASITVEKEQHKADQKTIEHLKSLVEANRRIMQRFEQLEKKQHASRAQIDENLKNLLQQQINLQAQELSIANHPNRLKQLNADLANTQAQLEQARVDLREAQIRAPFDGKITEVMVSVGDDVADNQKLISLYNLHDVELRAQLPSQFIPSLQIKNSARQTYAIPQKYPQYKLSLLRSGASLNAGDASIDVFFKVPFKLARTLPLGYTLVIRLLLPEQSNVIRIPASALYNGKRIYQIEDQRLKSHVVQRIGDQYDQNEHFYLIHAPDLPDGASILKTKLPNVRDGLKVNPL